MPTARYSEVHFRPEGAPRYGMGHLYRCGNLAAALRPHFEVFMLIDEAPAAFLSLLDSDGIAWRRLSDRTPVENQVVVFDGYRYGAADFASARRLGNVVVAIDDLAEADFDCDLIISPGPQNRETDYRAAAGRRFLLGPEFALINPCFDGGSYQFRPEVRRLFVGFGGSDPGDVTSFVVEALSGADIELEVLIGPEYRHLDRLGALLNPKVSVHRGLPQAEVARLMAQCDAAVSGGGTMCLELAAVGLPSILFPAVENHWRPSLAMAERGLSAFGAKIPEQARAAFRRAVEGFLADRATRQAIHNRTREIFRAPGVDRVASEIAALAAARRSSGRIDV
jgi:spore coat polysaccharide biosynthesis predicted glycosyltransferase SpsG